MLSNFLKITLVVLCVSVALTLLYSLTELVTTFKVKDLSIGIRYCLYLMPLGVYIMFPLITGISVTVLLRRVFSRNLDLIAQSFGLSPLRFSLPVIGTVLLFSVLFLLLNESFIPGLFREVWYIEKVFKKKEEVGSVVEDLWLVRKAGNKRYFVFVDSLDTRTGRFANIFLLITSEEGKVSGVVEGMRGVWSGRVLKVEEGKVYSFDGESKRGDLTLDAGIDLREVSLFAEKIEHLRTSSLLTLYRKGGAVGFDTDRYLAEVLFRGGMSFLSFLVVVPLIKHALKRRSVRTSFLVLLLHLVLGWLVVISPKVVSVKVGLPPLFPGLLMLAFFLYVLKGVYDLGKGFRV